VRVDREWHLGGLADALDEPVEPDRAHLFRVLAAQLAGRSYLVTADRMYRLTVKFTMVGARFWEADFMRINLACEPPTVWLMRFSCIVEGAAAGSSS